MEFHRFDDAAEGDSYLAVGATGRCFRLSGSAYRLLQARAAGATYERISEAMDPAKRIPPETLRQHGEVLETLLQKFDSAKPTLPSGFLVAIPVIPGRVVAKITPLLTWLYHRLVLSLFFAAAVSLIGVIHLSGRFTPHDATIAYLLFLASILVHEFGHATACQLFGVSASHIGAAIYIVYPAMYSDVSAVWRLKRLQRVVVDLGGNYFQSIIGVGCGWLYVLTGWEPLRGATLMIFSAVLFSLNPIFRFDGYWVLSDLLGVPNLSAQSRKMIKNYATRSQGASPSSARWTARTSLTLAIYGLLSIGIWIWFMSAVWPMLMWHRLLGYPGMVRRVLEPFLALHLPSWGDCFSLVVTTLLLYGAGFLMLRGLETLRGLLEPFKARFLSRQTSTAAKAK